MTEPAPFSDTTARPAPPRLGHLPVLLVGLLVAGVVTFFAVRQVGRRAPSLRGEIAVGEAVGALLLADLEGRAVRIAGHSDHEATVLWFWSASCRCVRECEERITSFLRDVEGRGVRFVVVDANDSDEPAEIRALLADMRSPYAVLRDPGAREAMRLGIDASASIAVLDAHGRLRYRGAIDDDLRTPTRSYLRQSVEAVLAGAPVEPTEVESYGCAYPLPEGL